MKDRGVTFSPARPELLTQFSPDGYVEGLNDARTPLGKRRASARRGWAGEKNGFFSILLTSIAHLEH